MELYIAAINLDPSDLTPRRNLSSANFELGDYTGCLEAIDRALLHEQDPEKLRVLKLRQAKCFFYLGKFSEIKQTLAVSGDEEAVQLLKAAKGYEVQTDITKAREELVESPMLRPCLWGFLLYSSRFCC